MQLPQRSSLISETARVLREGIAAGEWRSRLPGERILCVRLQVSRSTLREALRLLEQQRLLLTGPGRLREIRRAPTHGPAVATNQIGALIPPTVLEIPQTIYYLHELREQLQNAGFHLRIFSDRRLGGSTPQKFLESLRQESRIAGWLLFSVPAAVQRWCETRALPALVVGSCHEGVRLPSFDVDFHATCRHAVGLLRARGHRHLGLLRGPQESAGMKASEAGFLEGSRLPGDKTCVAQVIVHDATPEGLCLSLDRALAHRHSPTGFVVCDARHALCAGSYLLSRKFSLPGDFSLISRDHDDPLAFFRPEITRYDYRKALFAQRLSRLAFQLATQGNLIVRNYRLIPKLISGHTVGPPSR